MKNYALSALVAGALAGSLLGLAGVAAAAPGGPSKIEDTVRTLESSGYHVILNRSGAAPLASCSVTSVRPGQTFSTVDSRGGGSPSETILSKTVVVDVAC
ncbi:hypothetical protein CIW52_27735 [Mycolicibacterium sp. P9-64]|uniref:hypothetical protein n=1 Tax=Mycolicibacterium sp. P9-64 TaxID=2024612 RepID=UPI0011EC3E57|nr:hypothetical protein [Mycolicibacterium sp. P9-64]KAA0079508.1 hypothetical protein CIW52_27735 [Mycolicibacterium sp. P9-64]